MLFDIETQKDLINKLDNEASSLADYLFPDYCDKYVNTLLNRIEILIKTLKNGFLDENTYIELRNRETGEIEYRYFEQGDIGALCYKASQFYAWADCDDTYEVVGIMCNGEALYYKGWQPCMLFEFVNCDGTIVYSAEFPEWDH